MTIVHATKTLGTVDHVMINLNGRKNMNRERFEDMTDENLLQCILSAVGEEGCSDTIAELIARNKGYWREQLKEVTL